MTNKQLEALLEYIDARIEEINSPLPTMEQTMRRQAIQADLMVMADANEQSDLSKVAVPAENYEAFIGSIDK